MGIESQPLCCVSNRMREVALNAVLRSFHFLKKKPDFFKQRNFLTFRFWKENLENSSEITATFPDVWELTSVAVRCDKFKFTLNFKRVRKLIAFLCSNCTQLDEEVKELHQIPDHLREMKRLSSEAGNNRDR